MLAAGAMGLRVKVQRRWGPALGMGRRVHPSVFSKQSMPRRVAYQTSRPYLHHPSPPAARLYGSGGRRTRRRAVPTLGSPPRHVMTALLKRLEVPCEHETVTFAERFLAVRTLSLCHGRGRAETCIGAERGSPAGATREPDVGQDQLCDFVGAAPFTASGRSLTMRCSWIADSFNVSTWVFCLPVAMDAG
jgi:hypothetical protein